jgi:hypothetical protein
MDIKSLTEKFHAELEQHIEKKVRGKISEFLRSGDFGSGNGHGAAKAAKAAKPKGPPKPCKVPKCKEPSKGPRYRFLCDEHRDFGPRKLAAVMASGVASGVASGKKKRAPKSEEAAANGA